MLRSNPFPVVYRGTISGLQISAVNGTAFVDELPSAITDNYCDNSHLIEIYGPSGNMLAGVLKEVGSGKTYGSELIANGDFASWTGDNPDNWPLSASEDVSNYVTESPAGTARIVSDSTLAIGMYQSVNTTAGALYALQATIGVISTGWRLQLNTPSSTQIWIQNFFDSGIYSTGITCSASFKVAFYRYAGGGLASEYTVDDVSFKKVLTPSSAGAVIVSAKGGSTQNFRSVATGFTYNAASYYCIVKKMR